MPRPGYFSCTCPGTTPQLQRQAASHSQPSGIPSASGGHSGQEPSLGFQHHPWVPFGLEGLTEPYRAMPGPCGIRSTKGKAQWGPEKTSLGFCCFSRGSHRVTPTPLSRTPCSNPGQSSSISVARDSTGLTVDIASKRQLSREGSCFAYGQNSISPGTPFCLQAPPELIPEFRS